MSGGVSEELTGRFGFPCLEEDLQMIPQGATNMTASALLLFNVSRLERVQVVITHR